MLAEFSSLTTIKGVDLFKYMQKESDNDFVLGI